MKHITSVNFKNLPFFEKLEFERRVVDRVPFQEVRLVRVVQLVHLIRYTKNLSSEL